MANSNFIETASKETFEANEKVIKQLVEMIEKMGILESKSKKIHFPSESKKFIAEVNAQLEKGNKIMSNAEKIAKRQADAETKLRIIREKGFAKFEANIEKEKKAREDQIKKESDLRERLAAQRKREEALEAKKIANIEKEKAKISVLEQEYNKLVAKMNVAAKSVQNLTAKKSQGIKLSDKEQAELKQSTQQFQKYQSAVIKADHAVSKFNRNVGNYPVSMGKAVSSLKSLASAFGFTSAVFILADAIKDAFERVREFDKEMQNLAGILRTTRGDVKDIERAIINVASVSTKTSNEVAKLASSLFTLGKSREEVKLLLKPVNDLSIALGATSDESGEFLVQTLNAFGAGSEEGERYADVIAAIRTSTSLDFQKMRDSFQYIAPISKLLNKDIEYTGALVGILADNSLKAESAGRLLSTAQIKLASEGKTLDEALEAINKTIESGATEIEILAVAGDYFGAQAAKVGAILAQNTDKIKLYENQIRNSSGALDDLVNQQLESFDAKIKIVDSSWEKLILTLENGNGVFAKISKRSLDSTSKSLDNMSFALGENVTFWQRFQIGANLASRGLRQVIPWIKTGNGFFEESIDKLKKDTQERYDNAEAIDAQIAKFVKLNGSLAPFKEDKFKNTFSLFVDETEEAIISGRTYNDVLKKISEQQELLKTSTANEAGAILERIDALEKERKAWERNKATKKKPEKKDGGTKEAFDSFNENLDAAIDLEMQRVDLNLEANQKIIDNENALFQDRLKSNNEYTDELIYKYELERDIAISNAKGIQDEITRINEEFESKKTQAVEQGESNRDKIFDSNFQNRISEAEQLEADFERRLDKQVTELQTELLKQGKSTVEIERRTQELIQEEREKALNKQLDFLEKELLTIAVGADERIKIEEKVAKIRSELTDQVLKKELTAEERRQEIIRSSADLMQNVGGIFDSLTEGRIQKIDIEIEKNNEKFDNLLENERLTEEEKKQLEQQREIENDKLEKKKIEQQRKQAIFNKAISLAQIGVNTAEAISKANPVVPLMVLAAAVGAAQAATVIATPIPAYADGKKETDSYTGAMLYGEAGQTEIQMGKDGKIKGIASTPTIGHTEAGDTIFKSIPDFQEYVIDNSFMQSAMMTGMYTPQLSKIDNALVMDAMLSKYQGQIQKEIKNGLKAARFNIYNDAPKVDVGSALRLRGKIDV